MQWTHQQSFDQRTRLTANVDYATRTSAQVIERNAVDPLVQTATLGSRVNFNKQYDWGTLTIGASRSQDLSNGTITQTLPSASLSPAPINFGESVTWSPSFTLTRSQRLDQQPGIPEAVPFATNAGVPDTLYPDQRDLSMRIATPLRIGRFNWQNDVSVRDFVTTRPPPAVSYYDPADSSLASTRFYREDFSTEVDWNTGINLPSFFASTWKLQPSFSIRNSTGGAFMIRNKHTGGAFVRQGKRWSLGASMSPTFFGFFPGIGPLMRIRHAVSPRFSWNYQPETDVPEEYARALVGPGGNPQRVSPTVHSLTMALSQSFEGKMQPPPGDTISDPRTAPKTKLLSVQTSPIIYDFEQAKEEGRNGWKTQRITNSLTSDLLRGFTFSIAHDLWDGPVGYDSTSFSPKLTSISARFSFTGATVSNILAVFTGGDTEPEPTDDAGYDTGELLQPEGTGMSAPRGMDGAIDRLGSRPRMGGGFRTSVTYDDQRRQVLQVEDSTIVNRTLGLNVGFSPTENWSASWNTQYNMTTGEFGQHVLRLDRNLHRWRATFSFVKAPNGNFAFNFFVSLTDLQEIKFQYDQRTVRRGGR